jgi:TolA-binding protein
LNSTKKFSSEKKKLTVRISKKDLLKLLSENEAMSKQITELQTRMNEMLEEIRNLKRASPELEYEELENVKLSEMAEKIRETFTNNNPPLDPYHHSRSDIFFDGAGAALARGPRFGSDE